MTKNRPPLSRILDTTGLSLVGAIADISAVVIVCMNDGLLRWIHDRPFPFAGATAVLLFFTVLLANALLGVKAQLARERREHLAGIDATSVEHRKAIAELERAVCDAEARRREEVESLKALHEAQIEELSSKPSEHDMLRFEKFISYFGVDTPLYQWIKNHFYVNHVKRYQVRALDEFVKWYSDDLTNFHDQDLSDAFDHLKLATDSLYDATLSWYFQPRGVSDYDGNADLHVPPEWEFGELHSQWTRAIKELTESHTEILDAYGTFIALAHRKRLTEH